MRTFLTKTALRGASAQQHPTVVAQPIDPAPIRGAEVVMTTEVG
jgi:hypothetical protein